MLNKEPENRHGGLTMKKFLLSAIALTLTFLMLTCAVLTGCSGKEATPSPDQKQSMQSGESVDSKKVEPAPTAEPQPTAETTETYYGFTLDGEARYVSVNMTTLNEHYMFLVADDPELAGRLQKVLEESRFRMLNDEEDTELRESFRHDALISFGILNENGTLLSYVSLLGEHLFNDIHAVYGYKLSDDEIFSEQLLTSYTCEDGTKESSTFEIIDSDGFHQLLVDIISASMAGHTCEEYYDLYTSGKPTGVTHLTHLDVELNGDLYSMQIFEY